MNAVLESDVLQPLLAVRITDVVDILLVTALVYTGVVWIRRSGAALVAVGILLLGALYVAARALGLELTAWIFQGFFAIFLIMIVVIFQEELRQLFERLAVWGLRRRGAAPAPAGSTDTLIGCLVDLARDHIGALVVLPGSQPLGRHVRGGIELGGKVSVPLLKSIFDPHSPGHDGAVIVEGDRVTRFATHLPLSSDFRQLAGVGTRHSAALGLAELTDALCLVVSEERGQISVAWNGLLRQLEDPQELGGIVREAMAARAPAPRRRPSLQFLRENWVERVASLVVVAGLWLLFIPGSRPVRETFEVPVTVVNLPEGYELEEVTPDTVEVTLSGPARTFYFLDRRRVDVTVDAALARLRRRTFRLDEDNVGHPKDVAFEDVQPSQVKISVRAIPADGGAEPAK